jgi:hypothetical protein
MAEDMVINPTTGNLDKIQSLTSLDLRYLKLDTSNNPLTGNLNISKADPEIRLTDIGDNEYSRLIRIDTNKKLNLYNRVTRPGGTGALGKALDYTGVNYSYSVMGDCSVETTFSISCWVNIDTLDNYRGIVNSAAADLSGSIKEWMCGFMANGNMLIYSDSSGWVESDSAGLTTGVWTHLVWVINSSTSEVTFYKDGVSKGTKSYISNEIGNNINLASWHTSYYYDGKLDEVAIFNRTLSQSEVDLLYASGSGLYGDITIAPYNTGLAAGWHLDETSGNNPIDFSGLGHTGTTYATTNIVDGKVYIVNPSSVVETSALSIQNGANSLEGGIITLGDSTNTPRVVLDGNTIHFNIAGTEYGQIDIFGDLTYQGDVDISKADPELRLTDTGDNTYVRVTRSDTDSELNLYTQVTTIGTPAARQNPVMTGYTTPWGVVSANLEYIAGGCNAWKGMDNNGYGYTEMWYAHQSPPNWIKFDFGAGNAKVIVKYRMATNDTYVYGYAPEDFVLEGSNNDSDWTTLDTQTGINNWITSEWKEFTFSNTTAYRYYRLTSTKSQGVQTGTIIQELELWSSGSDTTDEISVIKVVNSAVAGEEGIVTFGHEAGLTNIDGDTIHFLIGGVDEASINASGNWNFEDSNLLTTGTFGAGTTTLSGDLTISKTNPVLTIQEGVYTGTLSLSSANKFLQLGGFGGNVIVEGKLGINNENPASTLDVMGDLAFQRTGTVTVGTGSNAVVGSGTLFTTELNVGDAIKIANEIFTVSTISDDTNLILDSNHVAGASGVAVYTDTGLTVIRTGDDKIRYSQENNGNFYYIRGVDGESFQWSLPSISFPNGVLLLTRSDIRSNEGNLTLDLGDITMYNGSINQTTGNHTLSDGVISTSKDQNDYTFITANNDDTAAGDQAFSGFRTQTGSNLGWIGGAGHSYDGGVAISHLLGHFADKIGIVDLSGLVGGVGGLVMATPSDYQIYTGGIFAANKRFTFESDGTLSSNTTSYETLVLADNDIPNKKYVDDEIAGVPNLWQRVSTTLSPLTSGDSLSISGDTILSGYITHDPSNVVYGTGKATHVNLGKASTTGYSGYNLNYITIGGGYANTVQDEYSTIAGGRNNLVSSNTSVVSGGAENQAKNQYVAIAGGRGNITTGEGAFIGAGYGNQAAGHYTSTFGDYNNNGGDYSFIHGSHMVLSSAADRSVVFGYSGTNITFVQPDTFFIYGKDLAVATIDMDGTPAKGRLTVKGSTNDGSTNIFVGRDSDEANVFSVDTNGVITLSEGGNLVLGTSTGTKIGTSTSQLLGFYNATPVNQPDALTTGLTTITYTEPSTPDYAIADLTQTSPYGFVSADEGQTLLKVVSNLQTKVAELEARLEELGLVAAN